MQIKYQAEREPHTRSLSLLMLLSTSLFAAQVAADVVNCQGESEIFKALSELNSVFIAAGGAMGGMLINSYR